MLQVHFFKDFDSSDKFRITGRHENSMLPSHFQVPPHMRALKLAPSAVSSGTPTVAWFAS
jgi:hypothetical protein